MRHREQVVAFLEKELEDHCSRKANTQWAIDLLASSRFRRYVVIKSNNIRIDRGSIREADKYDGKWVLETNDDTISVEDAACGYKGLMVIERCFRSLKRTQIKMTPMFHWVPHRIETHVKICVLALLIERIAEIICKEPWGRIRRGLEQLQISHFFANGYSFYRRNEIPIKAHNMLNQLKIPVPKLVDSLEKIPKTT